MQAGEYSAVSHRESYAPVGSMKLLMAGTEAAARASGRNAMKNAHVCVLFLFKRNLYFALWIRGDMLVLVLIVCHQLVLMVKGSPWKCCV